jgi:tRNA(fMet)-specific endonuclease VapC
MYMLDTNICIYIMKHHHPKVRVRLHEILPRDILISGIVLAELWHGVKKSAQKERNETALSEFLAFCEVQNWPSQAAPVYGEIRATLEREGRIIGGNDLLIAAHALYVDATLVTNNTDEFERIPTLSLENWV